ncbi:MAG: AAA family ATPase [Microbacteriaceae bacterium]|nr:AAA family ATPase [Microbacteriaceae bacterium]
MWSLFKRIKERFVVTEEEWERDIENDAAPKKRGKDNVTEEAYETAKQQQNEPEADALPAWLPPAETGDDKHTIAAQETEVYDPAEDETAVISESAAEASAPAAEKPASKSPDIAETAAPVTEPRSEKTETSDQTAKKPAENQAETAEKFADHAETAEKPAQTSENTDKPAEPALPIPDYAAVRLGWQKQVSKIGGTNPLLHFDDSEPNRIDLSTTHPSGLAQFITGQKTLLSSLIRNDSVLRKAKQAAGRVTDKAIEMRNMRCLETVHLGVGIARWNHEGTDFCAPVLLRPVAIRRYGRDFEIKLKNGAAVNPELIRVMRAQHGIAIDAQTLLELSQSEGVFRPQPVIDRLRQMCSGIADFKLEPRLVVSSFSAMTQKMAQDLVYLDTPILRAISGDTEAQQLLRDSYHPVTGVPLNDRAPETDRLLYDADSEQDDVISQVSAGHSLTVHTLPGTGGTQTVVNAIGELVRAGKRVLVVSPRQATIDGISHRLVRIGLGGLTTTPRRLRRSLVEAIRRNEQSHAVPSREIDQALVKLRRVLVDYRDALDVRDPQLDISAMDALRELAKLSLLPEPPQTTARLTPAALRALSLDRDSIAELLTEAARLGQFEYGPSESPWYGVTFRTTEEARNAYSRAVDVAETKLPRLLSQANDLTEAANLREFNNVAELSVYLRLLTGIRETLDRFKPEVFDRSLAEVIAAHAPRSGDDTMSSSNRRRLKKLAREYVRPGVTVTDMYARLMQIQQQRVLWQRYCTIPGARPEVPLGLGEVTNTYKAVFTDLEELDRVLGVESDGDRMRNLPIVALQRRLAGLAQESEVLKNIQERTAIIEQLRAADLEDLLADLSSRHVLAQNAAAELEQAWWQTALEHLLATNPALLSANTGVVERLEADFRLVDDSHAGSNGAVLATQLADAWRVAVLDNREEAQALRDILRRGAASAEQLFAATPNLLGVLAPVWAMSPYEVAQLPQTAQFDTLLLVDAAAISLVEAIGAIRRAKQVVAFGDPVVQTPTDFSIAVTDADYVVDDSVSALEDDVQPIESAYDALRRVLPELQLTRSYRAGGADLTDLVNHKFYDGEIKSLPWAGTFLGSSSLTYEFVRAGQGLPDDVTGAVESTDAEVEKVVQLVLAHAEKHGSESLMVITPSKKHAVRVWQAVLSTFAKYPQHRDFLLGERAEPFTVVTLEQATALSRDRVIFSIGYGRTPHGRVLSNFGPLSQPGGDRLVAVAMTRARRAMSIVSCFTAEHLDGVQARHGVTQLAALIGAESFIPEQQVLPAEPDAMVGELAERLEKLGLRVVLNYQGVIPLAAAFGERAIAVDIDFAGGEDDSMRHLLRLRPAVLRRLGWHYQRVQSFDLFADPNAVALRLAGIIGYEEGAAEAAAEAADVVEQEKQADQQGFVQSTGQADQSVEDAQTKNATGESAAGDAGEHDPAGGAREPGN